MENTTNFRKFISYIIFLAPILILAQQNSVNQVEFEATVYKPGKTIKNILKNDVEPCLEDNSSNDNNLQYHLKFLRKNDSLILNILSSKKVIPDLAVELEGLNIQGLFYYKKRLGIIDMDPSEGLLLKKLFRKTYKKVKQKVDLDEYGEPGCGAIYFLDDKEFILLGKINSFDK
tara:strand:+ start:399806 stop:400327 length:522 start_codon:yes stop_codon:yes gene_type:complete